MGKRYARMYQEKILYADSMENWKDLCYTIHIALGTIKNNGGIL